jgi:hypothetical protein
MLFAMWVCFVPGCFSSSSRVKEPVFSVLMFLAFVMHLLLKVFVATEASRRLNEDRRSGALELLLVTPLNERAILAGWLTGLKRRFAAPVAMWLSLDFLLWWAGAGGVWLLAMLAVTGMFIADCYTLCWIGLWKGLTARSSTRAFAGAIIRVLVLPWIAFVGALGICSAFLELDNVPSPWGFGWLVFLWFVTGYLMDFAFCLQGIHRLSRDLRLLAAQRFEPRRTRARQWPSFKRKIAGVAKDGRRRSFTA